VKQTSELVSVFVLMLLEKAQGSFRPCAHLKGAQPEEHYKRLLGKYCTRAKGLEANQFLHTSLLPLILQATQYFVLQHKQHIEHILLLSIRSTKSTLWLCVS